MLLLKPGQEAVVISHAARQTQHEQSFSIDGSIDPASLDQSVMASNAIEIYIPAFNDGRGLSVVRYLRLSKGYGGTLRVTGNILPDQLQSLFQLGVDEVLVGDVNLARHSNQDWIDANAWAIKKQMPLPAYQESSGVDFQSVWQQRRRAKKA